MKKLTSLLVLTFAGLSGAMRSADTAEPIVIDGLTKNVHRSMAMSKAWSRDGKMSGHDMTRLLQAIRQDETVSEAEARLLDVLRRETFSLRIPEHTYPDGSKVIEVRWIGGSLTKQAREVMTEKEPEFDELWPGLTPQNADKLALLLQRSPARWAEGRARLLEAIDRALKTPDEGNMKFVAYRALVTDWGERVGAVQSPQTQDTLRSWLYEALMLHDRRNPGVVKDFMYSWIKPKDHALRMRTEAAVEALMAEKGKESP